MTGIIEDCFAMSIMDNLFGGFKFQKRADKSVVIPTKQNAKSRNKPVAVKTFGVDEHSVKDRCGKSNGFSGNPKAASESKVGTCGNSKVGKAAKRCHNFVRFVKLMVVSAMVPTGLAGSAGPAGPAPCGAAGSAGPAPCGAAGLAGSAGPAPCGAAGSY